MKIHDVFEITYPVNDDTAQSDNVLSSDFYYRPRSIFISWARCGSTSVKLISSFVVNVIIGALRI